MEVVREIKNSKFYKILLKTKYKNCKATLTIKRNKKKRVYEYSYVSKGCKSNIG